MLQSKGRESVRAVKLFETYKQAGEEVLASIEVSMAQCILTNQRLVTFKFSGGVKGSYPLTDVESFRFEKGLVGKVFWITPRGLSETKVGTLDEKIAAEFQVLFQSAHSNAESNSDLRTESHAAAASRYASVPTNRTRGNLPKHLVKAITEAAKTGEEPVMIITGSDISWAGSLIVFSDRCVIAKSGVIGGFMSGSLGGSRETTFYFKDINTIEYNSGFMSGVLEILTASYDGTTNKDYWSETGVDPNKAKRDPWALSNTLPLNKYDYREAKPLIDQLRDMIRESKETKVIVNTTVESKGPSAADELAKLADLMDRGLITAEEFQAAKQRLLS